MSNVTYFPRYTNKENAVTNTTLHLFSQISQHSVERLRELLNVLFGDNELPLGITFGQQQRSGFSVPDGSIKQEPVHIVIETKVDAAVDVAQLVRHCGTFTAGVTGNHLMLLTREPVSDDQFGEVRAKAKEHGATFRHTTFEELCGAVKDCAKDHETHLKRVVEDFCEYCVEMHLLPDRSKWLRIVPCGDTLELNACWHCYYHATARGYSRHEYLGIYHQKSVRHVGKIVAVYDNCRGPGGEMVLTCADGADTPVFRDRIANMVRETKGDLGWDVGDGHRFFCVDRFVETDFPKTSSGGIQGARFWDVTEWVRENTTDDELAAALRLNSWE